MVVTIYKNKKGFVFSLISILIIFIAFAFSNSQLDDDVYSADSDFNKIRVSSLLNEIDYFKNSYFPSVVTYSYYHTMVSLVNYTHNGSDVINLNYTSLNQLVREGLINGSFNGDDTTYLNNRTITYFVDQYVSSFNKNYKANFSVHIDKINVYENKTYRLNLLLYVDYNITTEDNISEWHFRDNPVISVTIDEMNDPSIFFVSDVEKMIRPLEIYKPNLNTSVKVLNDSISEFYTKTFTEPVYSYDIGESFVMKLVNSTRSAFGNVLTIWRFDDSDDYGVFDSYKKSPVGKHIGNTRALLTFYNDTIKDLSSYNVTLTNNNVDCSVLGIHNTSCNFSHDDSRIFLNSDDLNITGSNKISIAMWINAKNFTGSSGGEAIFFNYGDDDTNYLNLGVYNESGYLFMDVGAHNGGVYRKFVSDTNISLDSWNFVVGTFDGDTGISKIYINGIVSNYDVFGFFESSSPITSFLSSGTDISIGGNFTDDDSFNGSIDEIGIYNKVIDELEIASMYKQKKAIFADYRDTMYGTGIDFDGLDDTIIVQDSNNLQMDGSNQVSFEAWIKLYNLSLSNSIVSKLPGGWNVEVINGEVFYEGGGGNSVITTSTPIDKNNFWYHIVVIGGDGNSGEIYVNGLNESVVGTWPTNGAGLGSNVFIGKNNVSSNYFYGIIDELKIYNYSMEKEHVIENYYNYDGFAKGCCNFITFIDPNQLGYDTSPINRTNISYSTRLFYDSIHRKKDLNNTMDIFSIGNISNDYNNIKFDICMMNAYNVFDEGVTIDYVHYGEDWSTNCSGFVEQGVY